MSFQWPLALAALGAVPLAAWLYARRERRRADLAAPFANPALLPNLVPRPPGRRRHVPVAVLLVALAAMVVGVARPHANVRVRREEATVVLAVDSSSSMSARDVRPSRLVAARSAADAFLDRVPMKFRVAVVSFASRATTALPPTDDRALAHEALRSLRPGLGTALGDAVALSVRLGRRTRAPTAVVVVSDGKQDGGHVSPAGAVRRARAAHVPVYTVLVGTPHGVIRRIVPGGFVETTHVPANPDTLRVLASGTGGRFFAARDDAGLRAVYEGLRSHLGHTVRSRELTDFFAGGSAALMLLAGALSTLWFRRVV